MNGDMLCWASTLVLGPLLAAIVSFLVPGSGRLAGWAVCLLHGGVLPLVTRLLLRAGPQELAVGGWPVPVGIRLGLDGLSLLMIGMTALVGAAVTIYADGYFTLRIDIARDAARHEERSRFFWPLWQMLWAALNGLYLSRDFFNIYVTLELIGLAAVLLTALSGKPAARLAALRYLLAGVLAATLFLLGVALLYRCCGVLDMAAAGEAATTGPLFWSACALLTCALLVKSALFPLHFWLPPAHANALAPVSAILSGLVIKAPLYLLLRFWGEVFAPLLPTAATIIPGGLGAAALVWGTLLALQQQRLKMLIAYSTVAQVGSVMIALPLLGAGGDDLVWQAAVMLIVSHACAKSAMFLAAGAIFLHAGHDRIEDLSGIKEELPTAALAMVTAGISLIGLPPSAGFVGKWLLLEVALTGGRWWWGVVPVLGSLLSAAYVYRIAKPILTYRAPFPYHQQAVPPVMEWAALFLALLALLLGLSAGLPLELLESGGGPVIGGGGEA